MVALLIYKNKEDPITNEGARVLTRTSPLNIREVSVAM